MKSSFKILATTLGMYTSMAFANGALELAILPLEVAAKKIAAAQKLSGKIGEEAATVAVHTFQEGLARTLGVKTLPSKVEELEKLVAKNPKAKAIIDRIAAKDVASISKEDSRFLAEEFGVLVESSTKAVDACQRCGDASVAQVYGLKIFIPVETQEVAALKKVPASYNDLVKGMTRMSRDQRAFKFQAKDVNAAMSKSVNDSGRLYGSDLRKLFFAAQALDGSYGKSAQEAATQFIRMADGDIVNKPNLAVIVADLSDSPQILDSLASVAKKINDDKSLKSAEDRAKAFCKEFAGLAKGGKEDEFNRLAKCYPRVFGTCSL